MGRAAIVHYWLVNQRGGEKVVDSLCRLLPDADIFTLFYDPERASDIVRSRRVTASFLNPLRRGYRSLLPLMPLALEQFDLRDYDLIVSSESGPAKGILAPSDAVHICYCHTPMRYLWELYPAYLREWSGPRWKRALMAPIANYLRLWDYAASARVDEFAANSENVRRRIRRAYGREAAVVHPPVAVENFYWKPPDDYYLIVSELVPYKRIDTAVAAFADLGRRLLVVGDGPEYKRLRRMNRGAVEFCGRVGDDELRDLYARCRALIVPGEEDFGMAAVEAQASGKPMVALRRGGSCEIADTPEAAVWYDRPEAAELARAVRAFERVESRVRPDCLQASASRFSERVFFDRMRELLIRWNAHGHAAPRTSAAVKGCPARA